MKPGDDELKAAEVAVEALLEKAEDGTWVHFESVSFVIGSARALRRAIRKLGDELKSEDYDTVDLPPVTDDPSSDSMDHEAPPEAGKKWSGRVLGDGPEEDDPLPMPHHEDHGD